MRLTVTTWNLQGARGLDVDAVVAHLRRVGSDAVLFQEIQRRQARRIARAIGAESLSWSFKHWPISKPAEGMAVLGVTVPAKARARALTRRWAFWHWRRRIVQTADAEGLSLVNLHLSSSAGPEVRQREVDKVVGGLRRPVLLAGDLNERPDGTMFEALRGASLRDAWLLRHPDDGGFTNWSSRRRRWSGPTNQRIDYIWTSPELDVVEIDLPRFGADGFAVFPDLSDHLPLTVTVSLSLSKSVQKPSP